MIVINKNTGEYLYTTAIKIDLMKDEMLIEQILTENFENPYFDFNTKTFYDKKQTKNTK